jgi:predicted nuclease of restriction endonuclease-like RecB superfamily
MLKRWRDGGMSNMKAPKRKFEYVKNDHIFNFKSSYELAYAKYLDSKGIEWEYEPVFTLSNGTNILPDFKLQDGSIVEIKGYFRPDAKVKWNMFCSEFKQIKKSLLTKDDLKRLSILD